MSNKVLSTQQTDDLLTILEKRFLNNPGRHKDLDWSEIAVRLRSHPQKLWSLNEMDQTEGEPDVVASDPGTGAIIFMDCAPESPKGRRSLCYDREGLESRKDHQPANNAIDVAREMGVEILDEEQYRQLQELGTFDIKTSSWLKTPSGIRKLGGALFGDSRYGRVFVYHNGAQSYYAARGFRAMLSV